MKTPLLSIGGRWLGAPDAFPVFNPADGSLIANVPWATPAMLTEAAEAAHSAFLSHRHATASTRSGWLRALAGEIQARAETFAQLIQTEAGKPITLARAEVQRAIGTFTIASEEARKQRGALLDLDALPTGAGHFGITRRFPLGVIAALTPFNFPLNLAAHKVAPALAAGNSVVLKPSPRTPLTALFLAETAEAAGLPQGLLNVVTCRNEDVSQWLQNPVLRMLSFTGSSSVGRSLHTLAQGRRCTLELGGNAAVIVHADASISEAVRLIAGGAFSYAGQSCISVQRVLVEASRYASLREELVGFTRAHVRMGAPSETDVLVGPMIDLQAAQRAEAAIHAAIHAGGTLLCGGTRTDSYLAPTILEHVPQGEPFVCEEMFAPTLSLEPYTSFDEALNKVNASRYGLQTGLFTKDFQLAWKAFNQLETGAVLLNQVPTWRTENMPYGGVKDSGLGREGVLSAMEDMSELRSWIWNASAH